MKEPNCIYCKHSAYGMIYTGSGYACPECLLKELTRLEQLNEALEGTKQWLNAELQCVATHGGMDKEVSAVEVLRYLTTDGQG